MNPASRGMHSPLSEPKPVVVVGGGLSGLAAAVRLAERRIPVHVLEQKPKTGGRAYSFVDAATGDTIDNGQHVLIAGYHRTMDFLERIGTKHLLTIQQHPTLFFHHPFRGFCEFRLRDLPAPFHLLAGVLASGLFSLPDKWRLLRAGLSIGSAAQNPAYESMTIEEWLDAAGQSEETKRSFWEPLAISIMNEHIARASAGVFVRSLRTAFFAHRNHAALAIPCVGLSELYVDEAVRFIRERGGRVQCNADVTSLHHTDGCVRSVTLRYRGEVACSSVILAVPHYRVGEIASLPPLAKHILDSSVVFENTPIVSVHLWFDNDFMPHDFVGLIGRRVQWVFNKRRLNREAGKRGHISGVISAGDEFTGLPNDEIVRITLEDMRGVYGGVVTDPIHHVVIREKRATFSCTPGAERLRPGPETGFRNLFLAGDWTRTGLPATIEGAIISGERCADYAATLFS